MQAWTLALQFDSGVDPNFIVAGGSVVGYTPDYSLSQAFLGEILASQVVPASFLVKV